jgi:hypothetical protein
MFAEIAKWRESSLPSKGRTTSKPIYRINTDVKRNTGKTSRFVNALSVKGQMRNVHFLREILWRDTYVRSTRVEVLRHIQREVTCLSMYLPIVSDLRRIEFRILANLWHQPYLRMHQEIPISRAMIIWQVEASTAMPAPSVLNSTSLQ